MASKACCDAGKPVQIHYEPKGKFSTSGDLPMYHTGSGSKGVILVPDIFGFGEKQVFQVADRIAEAGFNVVAIDPFRGKPWTLARFPPKPEDNFMGWISDVGAWDKVKHDVASGVEALRSSGASKMACLGFCWAVGIALRAGQDGSTFSACGGAHPALWGHDKELAEKVAVPVVLLPAKGDPPLEPMKHILDKKPFGSKCVYQRFDDQIHGFVAARGDWSKPEVAAAAGKAIEIFVHFLNDNLA